MSKNTALSQYDKMTKTPVLKLITGLSIPTILSMMGTNIYNLVDTAFVGRLGNSASGAIGVVFGFMSIMQAIGFLFGQGGGSLLSRRLGAKDDEEATRIASTGFFSAFFMATIVCILCAIFVKPLVYALGSTPTIEPYATTYVYYILSTAPFMVTSFTLNNYLRYEGKALLGMIGLISGGIINIAGDALFMFVFDMGIAGAGLSTAISQVISFVILISMFMHGRTQCKISIKKAKIISYNLVDIITTGCPSLLRQGLNSLGTIVLNLEAAKYAGDAAVAAMSIVSRVVFFLFAVSLGIGQGFQPVCAFNYGAGKYKRVKKAFMCTVVLSVAVLAVLDILALMNTEGLVRIFRDDAQVVQIGSRALRLQCIAQILTPFGMVTEMMMQTTGRKGQAAILSSLRGGILYIPLMIILPYFRGIYGVQEAQPLAFFLSIFPAIYCAVVFMRRLPD